MKKVLIYLLWAIYVYFTFAVISITEQMLKPKETEEFIISTILAVWYYPILAVFAFATLGFYFLLRRQFMHLSSWNIIRFVPFLPLFGIALTWIFCLYL